MKDEVRVGVLASGRGSNFAALLHAGAAGRLGPARIACLASDNPASQALLLAKEQDLPHLLIEPGSRSGRLESSAEAALTAFLQQQAVDLVCLAGFMRILRGVLLDTYVGAILNVHPSLLPSFPGLHAQEQALAHGSKISGCTVHFVDRGVDTGPIVLQAAVPVEDNDTVETLSARILEREHEIYPAAVRAWAEGRLELRGRRVHVHPQIPSRRT